MTKELSVLGIFFLIRGSEGGGGYLDNSNSNKFFDRVIFFQKEAKTAQKRPIIFSLVQQGVFGYFTTIPDFFGRFPKATDDSRRLTKYSDHCLRCPKNPPST